MKFIKKNKIKIILLNLVILACVAIAFGIITTANAEEELILNGGFEDKFAGWDISGPAVPFNGFHHSGIRYAVLGALNNCEDTLSQTVTIPASADSASLSYWYNVTSEEPNTSSTQFDKLTVTIRDSGNNILDVVDSRSNLNKDSCAVSSCYHKITFDMKKYSGQTVKIYFYSKTDESYLTYFRIDDVSVKVDIASSPVPQFGNNALSNEAPVCDTNYPEGPAIRLNWAEASGATSYHVYRDGNLYENVATDRTFYNSANVTTEQTYEYYIQARNANGRTNSNTVSVYVPSDVCDSSPQPSCYDGIQNQDETGVDCGGSCPACASSSSCGNGVIEEGEECDGNNFGGKSCETEGFDSGNLSCSGSCQIITNGCSNNVIQPQCSDGIDNDGDGLVDYPNDPGCENAEDDDETNNFISDDIIEIKDDLTGGECSSVGEWNNISKTCLFTQDVVNKRIEVIGERVTIDGNGHSVKAVDGYGYYMTESGGSDGCNGIRIDEQGGIVKNFNISGFYAGIVSNENNIVIENNIIKDCYDQGILIYHSNECVIRNNRLEKNKSYGLDAWELTNCLIENNIAVDTYSHHKGEDDFDKSSGTGISIGGSGNVIRNNIAKNNAVGIKLDSNGANGGNNTFFTNIMSENEYNFVFSAWPDMGNSLYNEIDTSNLVDGKKVYYFKDIENQTFDGVSDMGMFICIHCSNITLRNLDLSKNGTGVFFWETVNSKIEESSFHNNEGGIYLENSNNVTIKNVNVRNNDGSGIYIYNSEGSIISGVVVEDNFFGIDLEEASKNISITNSSIKSNRYEGLYIDSSCENISIYQNIFKDNVTNCHFLGDDDTGILLGNAPGSVIYNNNFIRNHIYYDFDASEGPSEVMFYKNDMQSGNYWSDFDESSEGCVDSNADGRCDSSYIRDNVEDNFPWTKQDGWLDAQDTICGNGILEEGEQCDGSDFDEQTCEDFGFDGGNLSCDDFCQIVTSGCSNNENIKAVFAQDVPYFFQELRSDNTRISPEQTNPENVIDDDKLNFVSLGRGGEMILRLEHGVHPSILVINEIEKQIGTIESAEVSVSEDGFDWTEVGNINNGNENTNSNSELILQISQLNKCVHYIKIKDTTAGSDIDGFDLAGIKVNYQQEHTCENVFNSRLPIVYSIIKDKKINEGDEVMVDSQGDFANSYFWDWNGDGIIDEITKKSSVGHSWSFDCSDDGEVKYSLTKIKNGLKSTYATKINVDRSFFNLIFHSCKNENKQWVDEDLLKASPELLKSVDKMMRDKDGDGSPDAETEELDWIILDSEVYGFLTKEDYRSLLLRPIYLPKEEDVIELSYIEFLVAAMNEEAYVHKIISNAYYPDMLEVAQDIFQGIKPNLIVEAAGYAVPGLSTVMALSTLGSISSLDDDFYEKNGMDEALEDYLMYRTLEVDDHDKAWAECSVQNFIQKSIKNLDKDDQELVRSTLKKLFDDLWNDYGNGLRPGGSNNLGGIDIEFRKRIREQLKEEIITGISYYLNTLADRTILQAHSPIDVFITDEYGNKTGYLGGSIYSDVQGVLVSADKERIEILDTEDETVVNILGTDIGTYSMEIWQLKEGIPTIYKLTNIPTKPQTMHMLTIDWPDIITDEVSATISIDEDGDGEFEETFTTGSTLDMGVNMETQISVTKLEYGGEDILSDVTADVGDGVAPLLLSELKKSSVNLKDYIQNGELNHGQKKKLKMKFKFLESAGNEYQGKSINANFKFLAT